MKTIQLDRDLLLKPLQSVTGVVERRQTLPILSNVLLEAKGGVLTLLATDLEIQVVAAVENLALSDDFSVTVSAKKMVDILRALPDGTKVAVDQKDERLQLKAGKSRFSLQTIKAEGFPRLPDGQQTTAEFSISQKELRSLLGLAQYAMAQQDIRYYLNGMLLVVEKKELTLVATDGHRLAYVRKDLIDSYQRTEVILPRKAVMELTRLLNDSDEQVLVSLKQNQVQFDIGSLQLRSKVVDGKFPDYTRVIPSDYAKHFSIDRQVLQQALQRAAILSSEKFRGVRWVLAKNTLRVVCQNTDQEEAEEELEIDYGADNLDIGFNITYVLDVLNSVDTQNVDCSFGDSNSSMLITLPGRDDFKYVVMPMRI